MISQRVVVVVHKSFVLAGNVSTTIFIYWQPQDSYLNKHTKFRARKLWENEQDLEIQVLFYWFHKLFKINWGRRKGRKEKHLKMFRLIYVEINFN